MKSIYPRKRATTRLALILALSWIPVIGQLADLRLVDEFDPRHGCESLEMKLDHLFAEASQDTSSTAYVVIHQGDNAPDNAIVHQKAINYARFRGFPADRYAVLLTKETGDIKVALWIGKNGKLPSVVPATLDVTLRENTSRVLFVEDTIEMVKIDGRETYIRGGNPSCLYYLNTTLVWALLKVNPDFDAEFRIKTRSTRRYRELVAIFRKEFDDEGAPIGRVSFVFSGRDRELEGGGAKLALVAISFVKRSRK